MASPKAAAPRERLVLLDANALMTAARLRIDLARGLSAAAPGWTAVVPSCVGRELESLGARRHAREARALAKGFPAFEAEGLGDDAIIEAASAGPRRAVLTNDRDLRRRLRRRGVPVLFVRGSAGLAVDGTL
ncbi:MAG TPA: hypothetical protein VJ547_04485 [Candidatus Thermoplasmatota archaeon]|nr:hypothetical protein [Candidatus Thermoplasmatota archaeon]